MILSTPLAQSAVPSTLLRRTIPTSRWVKPLAASCMAWLLITIAQAQAPKLPASANTTPHCPAAQDTTTAQLFGLWQGELSNTTDTPASAQELPAWPVVLRLAPHTESTENVQGSLQRSAPPEAQASASAAVVGDIDAGDVTLEESTDNIRISATWLGTVVESSCGTEIRGLWTQDNPVIERHFVLRKQGGSL